MAEIANVNAEIAGLVTTIAKYDAMLLDPATPEARKDLLLQAITARSTDLTALRQRLRDLEAAAAAAAAPAGISCFHFLLSISFAKFIFPLY